MFDRTARYYDLIYQAGGIKDYDREARLLRAILEKHHPAARTILDVGCGTGEHARLLTAGYEVDGIDIEPDFVDIAREKVPKGRFEVADMGDFSLDRRYDAVLCLFGSVGYARTLEGLARTLGRLEAHLAQDGLVIVEPWLTPEAWSPRGPGMDTASSEEAVVCRMGVGRKEGRLSIFRFEYLIGTDQGIRHETEEHSLGLFTVAEMLAAFEEAGLRAEHDPVGLMKRGLYTARRA
jgi:SAM-dependent methyltransferase